MPGYENEPYHYGFVIGYNQMFYSIDYMDGLQNMEFDYGINNNFTFDNISEEVIGSYKISDITPSMQHGFTVGIVGNLRLARHFDLRLIPSLSFGDRKVLYTVDLYYKNGNFYDQRIKESNTDHVSVELPLQLKCKSKRINNYAAYVIMGTSCKLDMYPYKDKDKDKDEKDPDKADKVFVNKKGITSKRFDVAAEVGAGFDFYTGFFKLGVEIKMSYGLLNAKRDVQSGFNNCIDSLRNKTFQLSFTFE